MPIHISSYANKSYLHQHVPVTDSTNSMLMRALSSGNVVKNRPYMLTASTQTAGRGQRSRTWQSPIGNLYLSLYHPINVPLSGLLSLVVGYTLMQLPIIQGLNRQRKASNLPTIGVKWANDIGYVLSSPTTGVTFNKLAGILIEPVIEDNKTIGIVIGVGMNIESAPHISQDYKEGMANSAVSLVQLIEDTHQSDKYDASKCATSKAHVNKHVNKDIENDQDINEKSEPMKTLSTSAFPRVQDLYQAVGNSLIKAIERFQNFEESTYDLSKFLEQYDDINILKGRQIQAISTRLTNEEATELSSNTAKNRHNTNSQIDEMTLCPDSQYSKKMIGEVVGIGKDGSLKLKQNYKDTQQITHLYNGAIKIIK